MFMIIMMIALAFVIQMGLGFLQMKHFSKAYVELRRMGKVAIGKNPGRIKAGTIVLFAVTDSGKIIKAKKMQGVTVLATVKDLPGFEDKNIKTLKDEDMAHCNKLLKAAIWNGAENYRIIMGGGVIPEKNSLFTNIMLKAEHAFAGKK